MKTNDIIKEAHIGRNVELTNIELTLIKSKWMKIVEQLATLKSVDEKLAVYTTQFTALIDKLCGEEVLTLSKIHNNIFSSDPIEDVTDVIDEGLGYKNDGGVSI